MSGILPELRWSDKERLCRQLGRCQKARQRTRTLFFDDLSKKDWKNYAETCGRSLAQAHALADDSGAVEQDIEPLILKAVGVQDLFIDDVCRFADEALERIHSDHEHFIADYELGAVSNDRRGL